MASIWGKAISIWAGNLNSGRSYLITAGPSEGPVTEIKITNRSSFGSSAVYSNILNSFFSLKQQE